MERYGLLGEKLSHSLSPLVHSKLCSVPYDLFEKSPDGAEDFIRNGDFAGINVTIPYKVTACCLCDVLSPEAERRRRRGQKMSRPRKRRRVKSRHGGAPRPRRG